MTKSLKELTAFDLYRRESVVGLEPIDLGMPRKLKIIKYIHLPHSNKWIMPGWAKYWLYSFYQGQQIVRFQIEVIGTNYETLYITVNELHKQYKSLTIDTYYDIMLNIMKVSFKLYGVQPEQVHQFLESKGFKKVD